MKTLRSILRRFLLTICALSAVGGSAPVRAEPVRRVNTEEKRIAITFDDGPNEEKTREILAILAENDVKATFFVIGENAEAHPDRIREISEAGHEIGNHTWSHRYLTQMSEKEIREEVGKTEELITRICGQRPVVFRPPGGLWSEKSVSVVEEMGYRCVLWSVDTRDWSIPGVQTVIRRVENGTGNGDVILFHDLADKRMPTPEALRVLLPRLKEAGFEFVTVSDLFRS